MAQTEIEGLTWSWGISHGLWSFNNRFVNNVSILLVRFLAGEKGHLSRVRRSASFGTQVESETMLLFYGFISENKPWGFAIASGCSLFSEKWFLLGGERPNLHFSIPLTLLVLYPMVLVLDSSTRALHPCGETSLLLTNRIIGYCMHYSIHDLIDYPNQLVSLINT